MIFFFKKAKFVSLRVVKALKCQPYMGNSRMDK